MVKINSLQILDALKAGPFREPAHSWLYEVRNRTGYGSERYADGIVVSVWPSRGIWVAGVEVKVSRSDWQREIDNPPKAAEIQKYCDYWWIAVPDGIINASEIPETWGCIVVNGKKATTLKQAPKLEPEPLSKTFMASVLRNVAGQQQELRQAGYQDGYDTAMAAYDTTKVDELNKKLTETQQQLRRAEQQLEYKTRDLRALEDNIKGFEEASGIQGGILNYRSSDGPRNIGTHYKLAGLLAELDRHQLADQLMQLSIELHAAIDTIKPKTPT